MKGPHNPDSPHMSVLMLHHVLNEVKFYKCIGSKLDAAWFACCGYVFCIQCEPLVTAQMFNTNFFQKCSVPVDLCRCLSPARKWFLILCYFADQKIIFFYLQLYLTSTYMGLCPEDTFYFGLCSWTDWTRIVLFFGCYSEKPTTLILKCHVTLLWRAFWKWGCM